MCISFKIRAPDLHVTCNGSSISKADRRYWTDSPGSSLRVFLGGRNGKKSHAFLGNVYLVGGFNPFEKYESNWTSSSNEGENGKYLKPSPGYYIYVYYICILWVGPPFPRIVTTRIASLHGRGTTSRPDEGSCFIRPFRVAQNHPKIP